MKRRGSGILLHITSLPSAYGIGDLGPEAYRWVDFLAETKQSIWQILPLNPTDLAHGNSPYQSVSAFAGNPLLISPERMVREGFLTQSDVENVPGHQISPTDYSAVTAGKECILRVAYERFQQGGTRHEYERFCSENSSWLEDFALFTALRDRFPGKSWTEWPQEVRDRQPGALESLKEDFYDALERTKFFQFVFFEQWHALKAYCNHRGIHLFGDIPIYVIHESTDVWANPDHFALGDNKRPTMVAGVPPDYFSETGQLWGNPVYRWDVLREKGYDWWIRRVEHNLALFDLIRVDHFRGLVGYWVVPAGERNAVNGRWVEAPAEDFLSVLFRRFPQLPIIAEDLGVITPDVREIMHRFGLPGMKVLLFAFGEDLPTNPYIPHNLPRNSVLYTGTHDNNTARGWFKQEATPEIKERLFRYLGWKVPADNIHWELIRLAMMSVANTVIFPMQDILGLGEEARMNRPATTEGNWQWRLSPEQVTPGITDRLRRMTELYGRA
ncbi:MAG: 4-alpha-glucanotransferase [Thermodesulfobacteriota bacterium]